MRRLCRFTSILANGAASGGVQRGRWLAPGRCRLGQQIEDLLPAPVRRWGPLSNPAQAATMIIPGDGRLLGAGSGFP